VRWIRPFDSPRQPLAGVPSREGRFHR